MGVDDQEDRFGEFWAAYPHPVEEVAARRAWSKVTQGENAEAVTAIIAAASAYADDDRVKRGFPKLPANWLLDRCWTSSVARPAAATASAAAPDLDALAALWAPKIVSGGYVPASAISAPLARHMRQRGLVTPEQLRRKGISF